MLYYYTLTPLPPQLERRVLQFYSYQWDNHQGFDDFKVLGELPSVRAPSLHGTALHCTALHCAALRCTALHCTALHCIALHCTTPALHCIALSCPRCARLHCMGVHCTTHDRSRTHSRRTRPATAVSACFVAPAQRHSHRRGPPSPNTSPSHAPPSPDPPLH